MVTVSQKLTESIHEWKLDTYRAGNVHMLFAHSRLNMESQMQINIISFFTIHSDFSDLENKVIILA